MASPRRPRVIRLTTVEFAELVRLIRGAPRDRGVQRAYALFAVASKRRLFKVATNRPRCESYLEEYGDCFVGVYDPSMRAGDLEDDLYAAGVRLIDHRQADDP